MQNLKTGFICLFTSFSLATIGQVTTPKPNVIVVLADDLGYGNLSIYGSKIIKTPNIDNLGKEGIVFTSHYSGAPVCSPSRASLMTGKHVGHCSVRGNQPKGQLLQPEETTLPEVFKSAGYKTAIIGKWGMGNAPEPNDPMINGFDHQYGYVNMWHAHNFYPEFLYKNAQKVTLEGNKTGNVPAGDYPEGIGYASSRVKYAPNEFEREALEFIDNNKEKPFFMYFAINTPHANSEYKKTGMEVPNFGRFENETWTDPEKAYATMVENLDNTVGKLVEKLKALNLDENTMIVFSSDNGAHSEGGHNPDFFDDNGPFRGYKRDMYEGGIRTPLLIRWPAKIKKGQVTNHVSAFWDILPTMCDVAGAKKPVGIDGISMMPTLVKSKLLQPNHEYLYWEFYEEGGKQAVLYKNWKGIRLNTNFSDKMKFELYNLSADPAELHNVADQNPEMVKKMIEYMGKAHTPFKLTSLFKSDPRAQKDVQGKK
ncbi:MAG: arylsulfatase [Pseudarcicella sp.]|nr:arylsulfatase [Pseudarcicella sp.]